jgi:hypothetical protein
VRITRNQTKGAQPTLLYPLLRGPTGWDKQTCTNQAAHIGGVICQQHDCKAREAVAHGLMQRDVHTNFDHQRGVDHEHSGRIACRACRWPRGRRSHRICSSGLGTSSAT